MARVGTYVNFLGNTEQAFEFYREVFGGEFTSLVRMGEMHPGDLSDEDKTRIMHICLPIVDGHELMGTDFLESMGHQLLPGNNVTIVINGDDLAEAERIHAGLAGGGPDDVAIFAAPWGGHYGSCVDPFGIRWMFNVT